MSHVRLNVLNLFELPVVDLDRAQRFYETVLDASLDRSPMGPDTTLAVFPYAVSYTHLDVYKRQVFVAVGLHAGLGRGWPASLVAAFFASLVIGIPIPGLLHRWSVAARGGVERLALQRVHRFLSSRPDWRVRLYRTPAGLRLMAVHRPFDPRGEETKACFDALGVDPVYARMCFNQRCFRARLTPKPWRIGLQRLRAPYSAAWRPEHALLPARQAWICLLYTSRCV